MIPIELLCLCVSAFQRYLEEDTSSSRYQSLDCLCGVTAINFPLHPSTDALTGCDPISRGHPTILLSNFPVLKMDKLLKQLTPGPSFPSHYGNSSLQRGWRQWKTHYFKQIWSQMHWGKKKLNYACRELVRQHLCSRRVAQPVNASHICQLPPPN